MMVELIIVGVLYLASFIGITWLVLEEKDPNALVVLVTAASAALLGFVNPKRPNDKKNEENVTK
jgi:hypothetical protein